MRSNSLEYKLRIRELDLLEKELTIRKLELEFAKIREQRKIREVQVAEMAEARRIAKQNPVMDWDGVPAQQLTGKEK